MLISTATALAVTATKAGLEAACIAACTIIYNVCKDED